MVELMSTSAKLLSLGSNTPTPSAFAGAKTILPLLAVAAPRNFKSVEMVELMSTSAKSSVGDDGGEGGGGGEGG